MTVYHEIAYLLMADYHKIAQGAILYVKDEKSVWRLTFSGRNDIIIKMLRGCLYGKDKSV